MGEHVQAASQCFMVPEQARFLEIRTTRNSLQPYAEHFHSAFSLGLILDGGTRFSLQGHFHTAEPGDIILIAPGQAHSCNPVAGVPRSYHMLLIDDAWFTGRVGAALNAQQGLRPGMPVIKNAALFHQAVCLVDAFISGAEEGMALIDLFCLLQARYQCFVPADLPPSLDVPPLDAAMLSDMNGDIDDFSVSRLAHYAGVRRESFSRAVHRKTGLPPSRYLHCLRLEKARRMLRLGASIAEAANAAGYVDQSHFHRMFVRFYSVTPGCYRHGMSHPYKK